MEIIVHQAILHVLDTTLDAPVLSGSCMEMTAEKTAYLQYHIEKLLASDDIRQCRPLPDSAFRYELEQNKDFIDLSCRIAGVLFDYMHAHTTIPGADLAVVDSRGWASSSSTIKTATPTTPRAWTVRRSTPSSSSGPACPPRAARWRKAHWWT